MVSEQLRGHLEPLILAMLADSPAHGYAMIDKLRSRSAGVFDLAEGSVYPALHRLERDGLVTSRVESVGGRSRRVYRLTRKGSAALDDRRAAWSVFSSAVTSILGVQPS